MVPSSRACPPQAELWCGRFARRPNVSLIWQATQIVEPARTWIANARIARCPDRTDHTSNSCRSRPIKHDDVLDQLKGQAASRRLERAGLDLICARHPAQPAVGTKRWPQSNKKVTAHLDTHLPHVSNPALSFRDAPLGAGPESIT